MNLFSQIQTDIYVPDVKTIEYVRVKYCVDSLANISKVNIIDNKTTYKNKKRIRELKEFLLGIQYYPDSKLKKNCYETTFQFINSKYENKFEIPDNKRSDCKSMKTGEFRYGDPIYGDTRIKRDFRIQRESNSNFYERYKVKWISECEYHLIYDKVNSKDKEYLKGESIKTQIIDVFPEGYLYRSNLLDRSFHIGMILKK